METKTGSELEFQLMRLFRGARDVFAYHQWPSERERWQELVIALFSRVCPEREAEMRDAVAELDDLGLLEIDELVTLAPYEGQPRKDSVLSSRVMETLRDRGFDASQTETALATLIDAARSLHEHCDGKIQKYLRHYGEAMLSELPDYFSFSRLKPSDVEYAFTYWLQNTLNMPISLKDEKLTRFCERFGGDTDTLVAAADRLDINLALVDDLAAQAAQADPGDGEKN